MNGRVPTEPGSHPAGHATCGVDGAPRVDPSRVEVQWPLQSRHAELPAWAQDEMHVLLCEQMNAEMAPDIRGAAKRTFGGNCTFSDDDMAMLEHFARWAIEQGYRADITDKRTLANIEKARAERFTHRDSDRSGEAGETAKTGSTEGESAGPKDIAQPVPHPSKDEESI